MWQFICKLKGLFFSLLSKKYLSIDSTEKVFFSCIELIEKPAELQLAETIDLC